MSEYFLPSAPELSIIEQIEAAVHDTTIPDHIKKPLIRYLWNELEEIHGSKIVGLHPPDSDRLIKRPNGKPPEKNPAIPINTYEATDIVNEGTAILQNQTK